MTSMSTTELLLTFLGLTVVTLITRTLFLIPEREVPLPKWLNEALRYAPLAALVAVIAPEVFMKDGALIQTWRDAKLFGLVAGVAYFAARRGMLGTIVAGLAVFLSLRFGLGW